MSRGFSLSLRLYWNTLRAHYKSKMNATRVTASIQELVRFVEVPNLVNHISHFECSAELTSKVSKGVKLGLS